MEQKTYEFPAPGKATIKKSLAPPTNKRVVGMLELCGFTSFKEMFDSKNLFGASIAKMDVGVTIDGLKTAMDCCLIEGSDGIDFEALDLRLSDEVVQDFFDQRSRTLAERAGQLTHPSQEKLTSSKTTLPT